MMKNTIFWQLLTILLIDMTPRDSSAREIALVVTTPGPTVNGTMANNMIQGINLLTESITWLQDKMPSDKYFHGTIDNIEKDILSLPIELADERYEMLATLYILKNRFTEARSVLEVASKKLKSQCHDIINAINTNDYSEMLLKYTAKSIVKLLSLFNGVLEGALNKLIEIQDILTKLKALVVDYNATLSLKAEKINQRFENKEHIFQIFTYPKYSKQQEVAEVTFEIPADTRFRDEIIAFINQLRIQNSKIILNGDNEGNENPPVKIEKAVESISELLSQVAEIREYISQGRDLITKYGFSLEVSILGNEDTSMENMKYIFKSLKDNIVALKNASSSYITGALPEL